MGALTTTILERADPSRVTGIEPSEGFLTAARASIHDNRVEFRLGDAQSLPLKDTEAVDPMYFNAASISAWINGRRASKIIFPTFASTSTACGAWPESSIQPTLRDGLEISEIRFRMRAEGT
jgi:hypothetical protein